MSPPVPGAGGLPRRVEHVDTDAYGVVHFSRYAAFAEIAVLEALDRCGAGLFALQQRGLEIRVREVKLSYAAPARFGDELLLEAEMVDLKEAWVRMAVHVRRRARAATDTENQDLLLVEGHLELVLVERTSGRPVLIPEDLRCLLANSAA